MLGNARKSAAQIQALDRIAAWTRTRFSLSQDAVVLVSELACSLPGCPPLETVIAFWENEHRHHLKLFKTAVDVVEDDLPPYWMKEALIGSEWDTCC